MDLRETIDSILTEGEKSRHLKCFVEICISLAISCLNNSRFRNEIFSYLNHSTEDIAVDLIGDLFKTEDRRFVIFEKYFSGTDIMNTESDILKAKLSALIYNCSNQRISKLRIEFGEIFFSIEKAVNENIKRHPDIYKTEIMGSKIFISSYFSISKPDNNESCDQQTLLEVMFGTKFKTVQIPEVMNCIFEFLNRDNEYSNKIELNFLITVITNFYKKRIAN